MWKDGKVIDLGTLGGNGASANAITDDGRIFGSALNTIPDSDSAYPFFVPGATQVHAVLWKHHTIQDLGTLGGSDSVVYQANNSGQAMGVSFTDNVRPWRARWRDHCLSAMVSVTFWYQFRFLQS